MLASEARGAWQDIEQRLRPYVARRVASASDVDDILQEILVRIHRGLSALRDGESFGGWVYRVAQNAIVDAARARARSPLECVGEAPDLAAPLADEADHLQGELGACVALFVARLPAPYREAVTLTELQGLTQRDAAEMLGITLAAMKSRALRGREKIREMFEECCRISVDGRGRILSCEPRGSEELCGRAPGRSQVLMFAGASQWDSAAAHALLADAGGAATLPAATPWRPLLALLLLATFLALAFGVKTWRHWQATKSTGFHGVSGRPGSAAWFGGVLFTLGLLLSVHDGLQQVLTHS